MESGIGYLSQTNGVHLFMHCFLQLLYLFLDVLLAFPAIFHTSHGTFVHENFVPGNESSIGGTFVLGNFRLLELSFPRTFVP